MAATMTIVDTNSPFLAHVNQLADVEQPHELASYLKAVNWAQKQGVKTPQQTHRFDSVDDLSEDMLDQHCVIKLADGWSAKAMMVIDREPNNRFFDHVTLRSYGLKKLKEKLTQLYNATFSDVPQQWVVEAREPGALSGTVTPVSYSFYVFNGVVGLISQTDYNFATRRVSYFDGAFSPLAFGKDVSLSSSELVEGHHLIPQHAARYVKLAQTLSLATKAPFVAVQLFATAKGPVFAGLDFAPRVLSKQAVKLSADVVKQLDDKFNGAQARIDNGTANLIDGQQADGAVRFSVALSAVDDAALASVEEIPDWKYQRLAAVAEKGESRGAWRLSDKYKQLKEAAPNKLAELVNDQMRHAWDAVKQLNAGV